MRINLFADSYCFKTVYLANNERLLERVSKELHAQKDYNPGLKKTLWAETQDGRHFILKSGVVGQY